ncbi:MAG: hypothetical protein BWY80_00586 [Firmicutes bacterium ADurb.Bin456]|nr:MAG: hypothetical protein BWY80_00586 [Firmicutes bacterium ADurb.Bin456]
MKTRKYFSFKGRNFRLSISKWRERLGRGSHLRYFLKPREDPRTAFGKKIDVLVESFLFWLGIFLLLANLTNRPAASLAFSLPLLIVAVLGLKRYRVLREERRRLEKRLYLAGQKFLEEISKMDPHREFRFYLRDLLANLPGFEKVIIKEGKDEQGGEDKPGIDLEGIYQGSRVAVRCVLQGDGNRVVPGEIRDFSRALQLGGFQNGLYVTTGEFEGSVTRVLKEAARRGIRIKPVNRYRLMDLARRAGTGVFQEDRLTGATGEVAEKDKRAAYLATLRDSALGSRKKAKSYFWYGLLLLAGYIFLKGNTVLSLAYLFFAVLNFGLSACSILFGRQLEEIDPLEGFGQKVK